MIPSRRIAIAIDYAGKRGSWGRQILDPNDKSRQKRHPFWFLGRRLKRKRRENYWLSCIGVCTFDAHSHHCHCSALLANVFPLPHLHWRRRRRQRRLRQWRASAVLIVAGIRLRVSDGNRRWHLICLRSGEITGSRYCFVVTGIWWRVSVGIYEYKIPRFNNTFSNFIRYVLLELLDDKDFVIMDQDVCE